MCNRKIISNSYYPHRLMSIGVDLGEQKKFINHVSEFNKLINNRNFELENGVRNETYTFENYGIKFEKDFNEMISNGNVNIIATTDFNNFEDFIYKGDNNNLYQLKATIKKIFSQREYIIELE